VVSCRPLPLYPRYPLNRRLGGHQNRSRRHGEHFLTLQGLELRPLCRRPKSDIYETWRSVQTKAFCAVLILSSSSPGRVKNFFFSMSSRPVLRPIQLSTQRVPGALSPGVKWRRREADHSPPTNAEVKKTWIYTSTPPYASMAYCLA
jgi:hypothetical protein